MSKYTDLVLVNGIGTKPQKAYLFQAPAFSHLKPGTEVLLDKDGNHYRGTIICSLTEENDSEATEAMRVACGANEGPLAKIIGYFRYHELDYTDD